MVTAEAPLATVALSIRFALLYVFVDILSFEPYLNPVGKKEVVLTTFCKGRNWDSEVSPDPPPPGGCSHRSAELVCKCTCSDCRPRSSSIRATGPWFRLLPLVMLLGRRQRGKSPSMINLWTYGLHNERGTNIVDSGGSKVQLQMLSWYLWLGVSGRKEMFSLFWKVLSWMGLCSVN